MSQRSSMPRRASSTSSGSPMHVEDVAEHAVADRHRDAAAGLRTGGAAAQAVGRLQADGPHAAVADLLGDLGGDDDRRCRSTLDRQLERGVDLGQRAARELDVDHRAGDGDDPAVLQLGLWFVGDGHRSSGSSMQSLRWSLATCRADRGARGSGSAVERARRSGPRRCALLGRRASAPPTISMISVVMASWRARFIDAAERW